MKCMTALGRFLTAATMMAVMSGGQAAAEETSPAPVLLVELNDLQPTDGGCRFTFLITNGLGADLTQAAFEIVLFDSEGRVNRITVVDFRDLQEGKSKVRQFNFAGTDCARVGRVLINDATACAGEGVAGDACIRSIRTESRTQAVFGI